MKKTLEATGVFALIVFLLLFIALFLWPIIEIIYPLL